MEAEQLLIKEEIFIPPLVEVLDDITPRLTEEPKEEESPKSLAESLDNLFPEQQLEEKEIKQAKEVLGKLADDFGPEQLKNIVVEIKYLAESWLDDFERRIFKGQTLRELLHDKGGV